MESDTMTVRTVRLVSSIAVALFTCLIGTARADGPRTILVKDTGPSSSSPGTNSSSAFNSAVVNGWVRFAAADPPTGLELWKTDGTAAGTVLVKDIAPGGGADPTRLTALGNILLFEANDGTSGMELWKSDGTAAGTGRIKDINPGSGPSV
jgi:ELWxxDGT repeat protein